ncbi:MAG: hypothetical protein QXE19_02795, partial [Candidatus Bathyarchaeia archaeon]
MKAIRSIKISAILFIFLLIFPSFKVNSTNILITIDENYIKVYIVSNLNQNLTGFPKLNEKIIDSQLIQAKESIQNALKKLSLNALIENLSIIMFSNDKSLNVTIAFNLKNVSFKEENVLEIDVGWKSFKVKEDLEFKGIHYNLIGEYHLKPILENWKNDTSFSFYINKSGPVDPSFALEKVEKLSLLDFTVLNSPLSSWNSTYEIQSHKTFWHFTSKPLIDLIVYESGLNFTKSYYVLIGILATIECPGFGKAIENTIKINIGKGNYETIMIFIILVFIGFSVLINKQLKRLSKTKK